MIPRYGILRRLACVLGGGSREHGARTYGYVVRCAGVDLVVVHAVVALVCVNVPAGGGAYP